MTLSKIQSVIRTCFKTQGDVINVFQTGWKTSDLKNIQSENITLYKVQGVIDCCIP